MSRNEDIDNAIWADPDFESLSPYATLLYLWSWTNPRCDMAGIYKVSHRAMTESKVPEEHIAAALAELEAGRFAFYQDSVLWVRARVKRLRSRSPQMAKAVTKDLRKIRSEHPLRRRFHEEYGGDPWLREDLAKAYAEGKANLSENPESTGDSDRSSIPSREGTGKGKGKGQRVRPTSELPESFPRELQRHAEVVFSVLSEMAERHNAKAVTLLAVANVMMGSSHKPLVRAAYECAAYWSDRQVRDAVATYRNWLARVPDLQGFEHLGADGFPAGMPTQNVHVLSPAKENPSEIWRGIYGGDAA